MGRIGQECIGHNNNNRIWFYLPLKLHFIIMIIIIVDTVDLIGARQMELFRIDFVPPSKRHIPNNPDI